ncbi:Wadjet anti-phage system protein JetD domain-containing protein [Arthrobacter sp. H14]|uniref:Wadjet anti-phage system protein JetD domain-containing protein n=1 Tax=Arthrobacter sp. H14 TaxID=1312959 RepID=UPI000688B531|nr:Wadjet anti-phage system protein JetD domain-containing protein [Arthrobacter sp. H14]
MAANAAPAPSVHGWTTLAALRTQSRKAWETGALLRQLLAPTDDTYPRRRPLKHPTAKELRDSYPAARAWAAELHGGAGDFSISTAAVGRNTIGANDVPSAAVFATAEDEIAFIGKSRQARTFLDLASRIEGIEPALQVWAVRRPLQLLELSEDALTAAAVAVWFRDNPAPGIYLRQLSLAGVHTKFVETRRRTIDEMVTALEPERGRPGSSFASRHGFLAAPERVRFRLLDPESELLGAVRDITVTAEGFRNLAPDVDAVIVTENLVNFLSLPARPRTLAVFGAGYGFSAVDEAEWLRNCDVLYWGDLDTHGFRILDQLRSGHPHVHSILMDTETLLAHRNLWGQEPNPSRAILTRLAPEELTVYESLRNDSYGPAVRLEQEHINWDWALERL